MLLLVTLVRSQRVSSELRAATYICSLNPPENARSKAGTEANLGTQCAVGVVSGVFAAFTLVGEKVHAAHSLCWESNGWLVYE